MQTTPTALFDISVLLDAANGSDNPDSVAALHLAAEGRVQGFICATAIEELYDELRRNHGTEQARAKLEELRAALRVAPVSADVVDAAMGLPCIYIDDAFAHACARVNGLDRLITLNRPDFPDGALLIQEPTELVRALNGG